MPGASSEAGTDTRAEAPASPLSRLRLLIALDALLVEGSVTGAAQALGLGVPAMSRILAQLRAAYGDEIVVRTGRTLTPTPFAEELRARVRAVSAETSDLMQPRGSQPTRSPAIAEHRPSPTIREPIVQHPPLAINPTALIEGQPDMAIIAQRLANIDETAEPKQRLARYIATVGAGIGQSRPLTLDEAADAMGIILDGEADPIQIGALLMAIHYRSITANELAGMVRAARRNFPAFAGTSPVADLDWPAYRSPRIGSPPWFLLAARLVSQAGHRVLLHGVARNSGHFHEVARALGTAECLSAREAQDEVASNNIAFLPLVAVNPQLQALVSLYRLFEMRSPMHMVVQLLNPLGAGNTILGVPSAAARTLQRDAAAALGWKRLAAIGSNRDVAQATPFQATSLALLDGQQRHEFSLPALKPKLTSPSRNGLSASEYCVGLWSGRVRDEHALETVISTAAIALMAIKGPEFDYSAARLEAQFLWKNRRES